MRSFRLRLLTFLVTTLVGCGFHPPDRESTVAQSPEAARSADDSTDLESAPTVEADPSTSAPLVSSVAEETVQESDAVAAVAADESGDGEPEASAWRSLFDGSTLENWKITEFGGQGEVTVEDGQVVMDYGQYMTGITYDSDLALPKNNYELRFEAQRLDGLDFFCGVTFPVDDSHCSFIAGGWGGSVTGISSIDGMDASENETTDYHAFKNGQWYSFRVRVTPGRIQSWIDDKRFVDADVEGRKLSTRIEVDLSIPLGFCCFDTRAALRNIELRELDGSPE